MTCERLPGHATEPADTQTITSNNNNNFNHRPPAVPVPAQAQAPGRSHDIVATPALGNKRRISTATGSRGVTSLTPEQLTKKRANDREAQRAIRERTKNQIDTLERRVQELTSQQPYQELQTVIRQKEAIQIENDEIRRRLSSALAVLEPILSSQGAAYGQHHFSFACTPTSPIDSILTSR